MRNKLIMIFLAVVMPLLYLISPLANLRYLYETAQGNRPAFFAYLAVCAYNEKNNYEIFDSEKNTIHIPGKYGKCNFYFSGTIMNGGDNVSVVVNNEPVNDVDLSFPQGGYLFCDDIYLSKHFDCDIKLRSGKNIVLVKSGKTSEKITVWLGK